MKLGLEGRSALVCASTGGLGLASARALAAEGVRVAVTGRRETVAQEIAGTLPGAVSLRADLCELASGAALDGYLKTFASEVARDGVTVNVVIPGRIATDRVAQLDQAAAGRTGRDVEEVRRASEAGIPMGRNGRPRLPASLARPSAAMEEWWIPSSHC